METTIMKLIDHQKLAYISYVDKDGYPNTKAMLAPRKREGIKVFYFTTNTSSKKVQHFRKHKKASIYFCDKRFFRGVTLLGEIEVLEDQTSKEMIWQEEDTLYYPEGVNDPDYCVLKFTAKTGEYYTNFKVKEIDCINKGGL